jgi:nicotinamidase-related amidase
MPDMPESQPMNDLPLPPFYDPDRLAQVWRVPYEQRAAQARAWATEHRIKPATEDSFRIALIGIDLQNTFCLPEFELYVGGRSGRAAIEDNRRLVEFIYRNLGRLTQITLTLDTHLVMQIFHSIFLVNSRGENPPPFTLVSAAAVRQGEWRFNPAISGSLGITPEAGQAHLEHYVTELAARGKYDLTIWPYHAMLGGIGHALVSGLEEAVFFHSIARHSQPAFEIKGDRPLTEHYSAVGPEVLTGPGGAALGAHSQTFLQQLQSFDALIVAGQAKSHCVAWTVADLISEAQAVDPALVKKIYLLEDCTSPVVIPGAVDYTEAAEAAYARFTAAGARRVRSTEPLEAWF